jgi:hypothetical protein
VKRVFLDDAEKMWAGGCKYLHFRFTLLHCGYFTVNVNIVLWLNEPEVPVKVRV